MGAANDVHVFCGKSCQAPKPLRFPLTHSSTGQDQSGNLAQFPSQSAILKIETKKKARPSPRFLYFWGRTILCPKKSYLMKQFFQPSSPTRKEASWQSLPSCAKPQASASLSRSRGRKVSATTSSFVSTRSFGAFKLNPYWQRATPGITIVLEPTEAAAVG
jgi:hypothetical protein